MLPSITKAVCAVLPVASVATIKSISAGLVSVILISEIPVFNFAVVDVNSTSEFVPAPFVMDVS